MRQKCVYSLFSVVCALYSRKIKMNVKNCLIIMRIYIYIGHLMYRKLYSLTEIWYKIIYFIQTPSNATVKTDVRVVLFYQYANIFTSENTPIKLIIFLIIHICIQIRKTSLLYCYSFSKYQRISTLRGGA